MKVSDLLAGLACVAFGLALVGYGWSLPPMPGQRYGAGLFPILLGGVLRAVRRGARAHGLARAPGRGDAARRPRRVGARSAPRRQPPLGPGADRRVRARSRSAIGFIPLSIAILMALFWRLEVPLWRGLVIAVVTTALIYIGFARLLRVALPRGLLEGIIW